LITVFSCICFRKITEKEGEGGREREREMEVDLDDMEWVDICVVDINMFLRVYFDS
jgi:hypothetical protein